MGLTLRVASSAISLYRQTGLTKDAAATAKPAGFELMP